MARSRPDMAPGSVLTGGLYFFTSALRRLPFESTTDTCGVMLTFTVGRTWSRSLRLIASSASGRSPGCMPLALRADSRQAVVTARWATWLTSQRGVSYAGWTTWPLVMTHPAGSMNHPVPVSRKGGGVMDCGPLPQLSVTSAATSEMTSTVAGLARSTVSCTESVGWDQASSAHTAATANPKAIGRRNRRIMLAAAILHQEGEHEPSERRDSQPDLQGRRGDIQGGRRREERGLPRARGQGRDPEVPGR